MADSDIASLWGQKTGADIHLKMGFNVWELHDKAIRGKSERVDFIIDHEASMENGVKIIPLKEHMFPAPALETTMKYFYVGDDALDGKLEVLELLAIYEVFVALLIPPLEEKLASRIGKEVGDILSDRIDMLGEFIMIAEIIVNEKSAAWEGVQQELQNAIAPHLVMLLQQDEFAGLLKEYPGFCFVTLSTAVKEIEKITDVSNKGLAKALGDLKITKTDGDASAPTPGTPVASRPKSTQQSQATQTPEAKGKSKVESPDTLEAPSISPSMRTVNAGLTPFARSRFNAALAPEPSEPFHFEYRDERAISPTPRAGNQKKAMSVKFSSPIPKKETSDDESLPSESGEFSVSDESTQWESCDEGTNKTSLQRANEVLRDIKASKAATRVAPAIPEMEDKSKASLSNDSASSSPNYGLQSSMQFEKNQPVEVEPPSRRNGDYHLSRTQLKQEQPSDPVPPARRSDAYTFSGSMIQEPQASMAHQQTYTSMPATHAASASRPRNFPPAYAAPRTATVHKAPMLDSKTAKQVRKGRLYVETCDTPTSTYQNPMTSRMRGRTPEDPIDCHPQ